MDADGDGHAHVLGSLAYLQCCLQSPFWVVFVDTGRAKCRYNTAF